MPDSAERAYYLPRLSRDFYQGNAVVLWTMTIQGRATGWLSDPFHGRFREWMLHAAAREGLLCPVYCLMPDHMHLVWMGLGQDSDQLGAMVFLRTQIGRGLVPLKAMLQNQAHDHVLREEERRRDAFAKTCEYILLNPVRAKLSAQAEDWNYSGCIVPGYPTLHPLQEDFWRIYWKRYHLTLDVNATKRKLPPPSAVP